MRLVGCFGLGWGFFVWCFCWLGWVVFFTSDETSFEVVKTLY